MLRLFKIENGLIHEIKCPLEELGSHLIQADWIDAHEPDEDERALLQHMLCTELPEPDEVEEIETSARCFVDQAGIHVHSLFLAQSEGRHTTVSVACILQKNCLITIREGDLADFRLLRMRAHKGQVEVQSPQDLLVTLLEQKVENHADALEDLHRQLEKISYMVLEDEESELEDAIGKLARLEDSNGKIRLCLMDTQRDISFLLRHLKTQPEQSESLREIMRDIETLMSHTTFLFDKINFLMESTQGFINIEQNQIIKTFSIAAVVFLPPTLVASIYGMNFDYMPELKWLLGYPWALGLMVMSGIAPYWYFKRKGWL
ncbi:magnesium and cobalt transport protein CorA [Vreelandella sulfidaeris]|jgi:magnesium transporter|uniref:Magnesium transport protein CorA n=2 Tax=Halomonadaceae TaxID=28256 RepID=A0A365TJQ7_9GAMM|nr:MULTISPECIES: magnesium/cobalt transporter CorA [Halomonas]TDV87362.1 magnesium transporter [Halomonas alkaliantarctica]ERS86476.1 magnesium/nickel/cobalt transporter CorA [Halomonas sp. PBN3]NVE93237.1 magnesium/cobalt transporter CorA [Halomonas titanicae]PRY65998.1 magnesium transporter [Halomonas ventosae]RBI65027.1 magnesium and cobalt transport protein CorA [Halomonas sulfidaeris]